MACVCDFTSKPLVCCMILLLQCNAISGVFQVVGPEDPLYAVSGEDLILPCSLKPNMSAEGMTVEWFRVNHQEQGSLVHLYKNGKDQNSKQIPNYQNRTALFKEALKMGNSSLKLSRVQISDEGIYKCLIQSESHYEDVDVQIIVRGIGQAPLITLNDIGLDGGISLLCETNGWNPEPVLEWLDSKGRLLTAEPPQIRLGSNGFSVQRRLVAYKSKTNHYICRFTQTDGRGASAREVTMNITFHIPGGLFTQHWKIPFIFTISLYILTFLLVPLMYCFWVFSDRIIESCNGICSGLEGAYERWTARFRERRPEQRRHEVPSQELPFLQRPPQRTELPLLQRPPQRTEGAYERWTARFREWWAKRRRHEVPSQELSLLQRPPRRIDASTQWEDNVL